MYETLAQVSAFAVEGELVEVVILEALAIAVHEVPVQRQQYQTTKRLRYAHNGIAAVDVIRLSMFGGPGSLTGKGDRGD